MAIGLHPKIFVSYKRKHPETKAVLEKLLPLLYERHYKILQDVDIKPGDPWSGELFSWLLECSGAVALVGKEPAKSEWCRREWWFLRERNRATGLPVIPISVDGTWDSAGILDQFQGARMSATLDGDWSLFANLDVVRPSPDDYLTAHHAWLRHQYQDAPLWGREPMSLRDTYVETECGKLQWDEINREKDPCDPFADTDACGGRHDLVATVLDLVRDKNLREPIVVQGPPGSGKSAFTLRLSNELLDAGLKPVLVRFRDLRLATFQNAGELIEDGLRIGPADEEPLRSPDPIISPARLDRKAQDLDIAETVFILDGWDEVSLTGNASYQAQLTTWLPKIREFITGRSGTQVRLVITGRPSAEVRASGFLRAATPVLTVRHMRPDGLEGFASRISTLLAEREHDQPDDAWALDLARLDKVFASYREWFEGDHEKNDAPGQMDVLGSPLLAYLTFRTLSAWEGDPETLVTQPTALYKALIDTTVEHAGKGTAEEGMEGTVQRGGERLRYLLQKVAAVISILRREAVSLTELDYRLEDDQDFLKWGADGGSRQRIDDTTRESVLHELVVNFYFKGGNTGVGCEFLHKSFREYLFAERIFDLLRQFHEEHGDSPLKAPDVAYWEEFREDSVQFKASRALAALLAPQWMSAEVQTHLFWLIEKDIDAETDRWVWLRDLLLDVYIWWAEGVHLRPQPRVKKGARTWETAYIQRMIADALPYDPNDKAEPFRSTGLDAHLGEALLQITALVHHHLLDSPVAERGREELRAYYCRPDQPTRFRPGGEGHIDKLFARINAAGWRLPGRMAWKARLMSVDLHQADLTGADLTGAELTGADLTGADLTWAVLLGAELTGAVLTEAVLREANLTGAVLIEVDLSGAVLIEAGLRGADLYRAGLSEADLYRADLSGADLIEADLSGAGLSGADLGGAVLTEAGLSGADLSGANLSGANLSGANLSGANLSEANLSGAELSGADLYGANLYGANLRGADLLEADLHGAGLSGANLSEADLIGAKLSGADLREADFRQVHMNSCRLQSADLTGTVGLTQDAVNAAHGNGETRLPDGLSRPDHWED